MKKFYMILAALLIGSVCFAQRQTIKLDNPVPANNDRSGWIGNASATSLDIMNSGDEYAIAPKVLQDIAAGSTVTKVKFYADATNFATYGATNVSYTIKIYENFTLSGDLAAAGYYDITSTGTAVYTQNVTAVDGWNEVVLTTPYTVTANDFWVAIHANGTSCVFFGDADPNSEGAYYKYFTASASFAQQATQAGFTVSEGDKFWTIPEYLVSQGSTETEIDPIAIAVFVEDGQAYVPTSDLEARWFGGISNNSLTAAQASYTLNADESLTLLPFFKNHGADDATSGTLSFDITADGQSVLPTALSMELDDTEEGSLAVSDMWYSLLDAPYSYTIAAQDMIDAGLSGTFDVCFTISLANGNTDPDLTNNSHCVSVTLNVASVEENVAEAVSVYPNPANDMFTVANAEGATIVVVNSLGQVVATIENAASNQTIDASNFANGTYFVKVNEEVVRINVVK